MLFARRIEVRPPQARGLHRSMAAGAAGSAVGNSAAGDAEFLSLAFLHLLETLSPTERVAFLLREAFDLGYDEIAAALNTTEANSRQLVARARKRLHGGPPRFSDRSRQTSGSSAGFLTACATGDPAHVRALLGDEVVLYSDGAGKVAAALNRYSGPISFPASLPAWRRTYRG
jgi:hypothetical protein